MKATAEQIERLEKAKKLHEWKYLESWYEMTSYAWKHATKEQKAEIQAIIKRKNRGEHITLPYKDYKAFSTLGR